jgi:hypothetical protein
MITTEWVDSFAVCKRG